jgi:hypothetical protein
MQSDYTTASALKHVASKSFGQSYLPDGHSEYSVPHKVMQPLRTLYSQAQVAPVPASGQKQPEHQRLGTATNLWHKPQQMHRHRAVRQVGTGASLQRHAQAVLTPRPERWPILRQAKISAQPDLTIYWEDAIHGPL